MTLAAKVFGLGCVALTLPPTLARAQSDQASLKAFAVHINRTPQQPWPGYGVYLGNGLILTGRTWPDMWRKRSPMSSSRARSARLMRRGK